MAAEDMLSVDPPAMRGFAEAPRGRAEALRNELAHLDDQVGAMLGGWRVHRGHGSESGHVALI